MKAAMKFSGCVNLVLLIFLSCFSEIGFCQTTRLPQSEVEGLNQVAKTLGLTGWDFTVDPCDPNFSRKIQDSTQGFQRYVKCNCSSTECHVTKLSLKGMNLSGTLPPELNLFPHLVEIDLTRNFLNGTIPPQWASLPLLKISLLGNRLTGQIPKEFGRITTLNELTLEANWLSGPIPPELGNLKNLTKAQIGSNGFNGTLPDMLANLKNLVDFRISQTNLSGKIPDFIGNWANLQKLHIQGTNMVGPIPSTISRLTNLIDLRISDMNGSTNAVPDLSTMVNMSFLILRNCSISGKLPDNLGRMLNLTVLDLSFNKFTGEIPQSFQRLNNINYMYLTRNFLTGTVPGWMLLRRKNIDLSYNNLTWVDTLSSSSCQQETVNLLGSSYTESDLGKATPCFTNSACPHHKNYNLHINCGGDKVSVGDNTYLDDRDLGSSSRYYVSSENNWAFSSTGNFLDNEMVPDSYIESNTSILSMPDAKLYMQARISPISLTYYGLCLENGNYTVRLHFAEIRITDGESFTSLGRRIFNVYIQGKLVMKDFNIKDKAQGSNKAIVQNYSSVPVENNTLEIRLYWAGKGTTSLPHKVFYGPLISAISVESEFKPPGGEKTVKIVVGILSSMLFLIIMILGILWWKGFLGRKYQDLRDLDLQTASFTLRQMKAATKNFNAANKIGEGGFGPVYKGLLPDGTVIAVKMLSSKSRQGNREFLNEIGMISAMQHPNLVKLLGCCVEGIQLLLVYEFMENNSLARALFGPTEYQLNLDWPTRKKICLGIARGLAYLHGESRLKIVHRDIKPTNVLLDKDLNPKISDFGLARLNDDENTHISTRIAGTVGYMAPEYATRGYLTDKADVYSFGVVILEVVSGKSNSNWRPTEDCFFLLDWAHVLLKRGQLKELIDPRLSMEFNEKEAIRMIKIVFLCTSASPVDRPSMSVVLSMLEGKTQVPDTTNLNLSTHYSNYSISNLSETSFSHSAKSLPVDFPHTYPTVTDSDVSLQSNVSML